MEQTKPVWLPHLEGAVPLSAKDKKISLYTIALEGWRRGLELTFWSIRGEDGEFQLRYQLTDGRSIHQFQGSKGAFITDEADAVCDDKSLTNEVLRRSHVPVPHGKTFGESDSDGEVTAYALHKGFPLVLKPTNASGGKGVIVNIRDEATLRRAVAYVRQELNLKQVIVEQFVEGEECRVMVLNGEVLGAVQRRPASVTGDGKKTIAQLIEQKNEDRQQVPHLYHRPIKLDRQFYNTMHASDWKLRTVPKAGETIVVKRVSNISAGGDPVDVTDLLSESVKNTAVRAAEAVPGLPHCGVDLMMDPEWKEAVVIEVNTKPGLGSHLFPITGRSRDIPGALIDFYFPDTKEASRADYAFFDLRTIEAAIKAAGASEITVAPAPEEKPDVRVIEGTGPGIKQKKHQLERFIKELPLIGTVHIRKNKQISARLAGASADLEKVPPFLEGLGTENVTVAAAEGPTANELTWLDDTNPSFAETYVHRQRLMEDWKAEEKAAARTAREAASLRSRLKKRFGRK
ncbi:ATP-grasp domain-containing protein [Alkalicoccus halolimnae]|uniref:ATP-grasp domain-containing protein n=1 Tax=Alkalicoccus halolimnae TaxID=1667239 RepID=A0A5C7FJC6_9BACI|nr:ATP-grasp domain-containing protein [Alkalicoccus halolimnae]TXF85526.1 ATP-grasp domain-containing protein [Alkalicoccus halolimnae]